MSLTALDYAKLACDTQMREENREFMFEKKRRFNYHNGVFLSGMERVYKLCGEEKYFNYIKEWVDTFIDEEGNLRHIYPRQLDDLQAVVLLFNLYEKTGDERYKKVINFAINQYKNWDTNEYGGFWHKDITPNQMWLDSLYMGCPNLVIYGAKYDDTECFDLAYLQMKLMWDNMRDSRTGLLYHCWDPSKKALWSDPKTGLAHEFWGRALGWYAVTVFDLAAYMPDSYEKKKEFINNGVELLQAILSYRDEKTKKWFQIVNRGNDPENWIETSCSCLFTYAIAKGVNEGYLPESYKAVARECYEGIINDINVNGDKIEVKDICIGTGVKTYNEYLQRPRVTNDLHGMGAFILMCSEYSRLKDMN